jgi:hypothetical protein
MIKMYTYKGNWVVKDGERLVPFKKSYDAWQFVYLLKEIRPKVPMGERSLYPVRSLNPIPERRVKNVRFSS